MHGDISMGHLAKPMGAVGLLQGMTLQRDRTHMSWLASLCPDSGHSTNNNCVQLLSSAIPVCHMCRDCRMTEVWQKVGLKFPTRQPLSSAPVSHPAWI